MPKLSEEFEIVNVKGLHARAATALVKVAAPFQSNIRVSKGAAGASAKSVMSLLILAAPLGSRVRVDVDGPDAAAAMAAVGDLIRSGFGE